jgi:peptidoglycan-N-acetylglucosamine deacetylase
MDILYRPPNFLRKLFPDIIWGNSEDGIILTVDDAPSENTPRLLELLDRLGLKAIFFCCGKNIEEHPREFKSIIQAGHPIGNHAFNHNKLIFRSSDTVSKEIASANAIIKRYTGISPTLFRPPYGYFDLRTINCAREAGLKIMLWSFLSADHTGDFKKVKKNIDTYLQWDSIVVMHDNERSLPVFESSIVYLKNKADELNYRFRSEFDIK